MTRPNLRLLPSLVQAAKLPAVQHPGETTPLEHYQVAVRRTELYPTRTAARLLGAVKEWERAADGAAREQWAAEYLARWCAAEFERTGVKPPTELPALTSPAPEAPPAIAPSSREDQGHVPELPLDIQTEGKQKSPELLWPFFLKRARAEAFGAYCNPLVWPDDGRVVEDPAEHLAKYRARFPEELADVLVLLVAGWNAGDRPHGEGWPAAPEAYRWEYSRLEGWFKSAPTEVPAQLEAWEGSITRWAHPLTRGGRVLETGPATPDDE